MLEARPSEPSEAFEAAELNKQIDEIFAEFVSPDDPGPPVKLDECLMRDVVECAKQMRAIIRRAKVSVPQEGGEA